MVGPAPSLYTVVTLPLVVVGLWMVAIVQFTAGSGIHSEFAVVEAAK